MLKRALAPLGLSLLLATGVAAADGTGRFEWSTKSVEARKLLVELQGRIESFQFGPDNVPLAQKLVAADPAWCMGEYYLSAVMPPPDNQAHLDKSVELSRRRVPRASGVSSRPW